MPQARSSGSRSSGSRSSSGRSTSGSRSGSSSTRSTSGRTQSRRTSGNGASSTASSARSRATAQAKSATDAAEARLEAVAQRVRKLNERIIDASRDAGETTLASYERALKAIASSIERGAGRSEIDWISNLATTQAKFIRDVTTAWTSAARDVISK